MIGVELFVTMNIKGRIQDFLEWDEAGFQIAFFRRAHSFTYTLASKVPLKKFKVG